MAEFQPDTLGINRIIPNPTGGSPADVIDENFGTVSTHIQTAQADITQAQADITALQNQPTGLTDIVQDTTPQLGGDLDVNAKKLTATGTNSIKLEVSGTGGYSIGPDAAPAAGELAMSVGKWAIAGDAQRSWLLFKTNTNNSTQALTLYVTQAMMLGFRGMVLARQNDGQEARAWEFTGSANRHHTDDAAGGQAITDLWATTNTTNWAFAVNIQPTQIDFNCTSDTDCKWLVKLDKMQIVNSDSYTCNCETLDICDCDLERTLINCTAQNDICGCDPEQVACRPQSDPCSCDLECASECCDVDACACDTEQLPCNDACGCDLECKVELPCPSDTCTACETECGGGCDGDSCTCDQECQTECCDVDACGCDTETTACRPQVDTCACDLECNTENPCNDYCDCDPEAVPNCGGGHDSCQCDQECVPECSCESADVCNCDLETH